MRGSDSAVGPRQVSNDDAATLAQAFAALAAKDWRRARLLSEKIADRAARDLITWRLLTDRNSDAAFAEFDAFLRSRPDWPHRSQMRARAEETMLTAALPHSDVVAWFGKQEPTTAHGMLRLGEALLETGDREKGAAWVRRGWIAGDFSTQTAAEIHERHSALLRKSDHIARANRLAWSGLHEPLNFMKQLLDADAATMMLARLKLQRVTRDAQRAYDKVPTHLKRDWGLLFDRARWLRKRGQDEAARPLLLVVAKGISGDPPAPDTWWKEVQYQVREALDAGETRQAYELAAHHRLPAASGEPFVAAEFLAGWIALRFLNKPEDAYRHFEKLASAAKVPVTKARAHYWLARTAEARGLQRDASANYRRAATFPLTYYGQLARDIVGGEAKLVAPDRPVPLATRQRFERRDEIRALRTLIALNETSLIREFSLALADQLTTRDEFILLTEMLQPAGLPGTTVRTARRGAQKNLVAISAAYPQIELPNADIGPVPSALVLGLVRQESEFNPLAVSSAGARGLMQLMPATARATAKAYGMALPVDADLFAPERNLAIGQAHLADLLRSFDGSYVLAIGAYNAGAHRVRTWIERYGDPRNSTVDTVDWIERIPFSETRSYVQRVLENVQVYRELLGDEGGSLVADLERGAFQPEHGTQTPRKGSPASVTARSDG